MPNNLYNMFLYMKFVIQIRYRIHVKESNQDLFQLNHYRILHRQLMTLDVLSIQKNAALQAHKPFVCHFIVQNT